MNDETNNMLNNTCDRDNNDSSCQIKKINIRKYLSILFLHRCMFPACCFRQKTYTPPGLANETWTHSNLQTRVSSSSTLIRSYTIYVLIRKQQAGKIHSKLETHTHTHTHTHAHTLTQTHTHTHTYMHTHTHTHIYIMCLCVNFYFEYYWSFVNKC